MPARPLSSRFFNRPAQEVALELVGCGLVRRRNGRLLKQVITETEAYVGPHDLACHASRGRTDRNDPMFGPAGTFYVYLVYGLHWMLNVVTGPVGYPAAVLIRSIDDAAGPGRLTKALGVTGALNKRAAGIQSGLWFTAGVQPATMQIMRTPRIGVDYAGPIWSRKPLRFVRD